MIVPGPQRSLAVSLALREQGHPVPRGPLTSRRALADEISELIVRELIFNDAILPGELLPSEKELTERYGVSRVTIRAALRTLKEGGLISVRQGVGATVLPRVDVARFALDRLCTLETFAREAGVEIAVRDVEVEELVPEADTAARLQLDPGVLVGVARRAVESGGTTVAWLVDHVRTDVLAPEQLRKLDGAGLDALLAHARRPVDYADCEIASAPLPDAAAARLGVELGTSALLLDEVVCAADGRPLARCQGWHLDAPDGSRFAVRRRRRIGD
ncbi:MAG TPA: GntR family transcriptional regulator [Conexibacter sp.]|jgi:DNA-binding GntR family transcriptional regulator|nr:GntR family transcriptional regulator [Conexibacter sp.]